MVTYTLNQTPVHRNRYDGASDSAKVLAEVCERLLEIEEQKLDSASDLVRRMAAKGVTRQAAHWRWQQDLKAISFTFPEVAALMREYRESIGHKEGAMSAADALRDARERRAEGPE